MKPLYESFDDDIELYEREPKHTPPHLHGFLELTYIEEGTLEMGVGQNLFHMEKGDLAIVFPGQIHHSQVFDTKKGKNLCLIASPSYVEIFRNVLTEYEAENPVISRDKIHPDVMYSFKGICDEIKSVNQNQSKNKNFNGEHNIITNSNDIEKSKVLYQSFLNIIAVRIMQDLTLKKRNETGDEDIIYRVVSYVAKHFTEPISLTSMARDLYISQYALSRVFSGTFHTNFNRYLNETRLEYALSLLRYTDQTITEIYENSGFESQRTFNRVFVEKYHVTPRDYRKQMKYDFQSQKENGATESFYVHNRRKNRI